jgi:hypothetical protein
MHGQSGVLRSRATAGGKQEAATIPEVSTMDRMGRCRIGAETSVLRNVGTYYFPAVRRIGNDG